MFDIDYRDRVFQLILTPLEEEDWKYSEVPLEGCLNKLLQLEPRCVCVCACVRVCVHVCVCVRVLHYIYCGSCC